MFDATVRGICGTTDPSYRKHAEHSVGYNYGVSPVAATSHDQKSSLPTMPTSISPVASGAAFACELANCINPNYGIRNAKEC